MPKCEDWPCCGHEAGGCPDSEGRFNCSQCGRKLPYGATSSLCERCQMRIAQEAYDDPTGQDEGGFRYDY